MEKHKVIFLSFWERTFAAYIYISIAKVPDIPICHEMKQESGRHTPDVLTHCLWEELSCPGNPKQSQNPQCFPTPFAWLLPFREESLPFKERAWSVSNSAQGNWGWTKASCCLQNSFAVLQRGCQTRCPRLGPNHQFEGLNTYWFCGKYFHICFWV